MKNRTKKAWIWYWGDKDGIVIHKNKYSQNQAASITFTDFDEMKEWSDNHSYLFKHSYEGYWSNYIKIEI